MHEIFCFFFMFLLKGATKLAAIDFCSVDGHDEKIKRKKEEKKKQNDVMSTRRFTSNKLEPKKKKTNLITQSIFIGSNKFSASMQFANQETKKKSNKN